MHELKWKRVVDLTHELHGGIPTWSGGCGWREEMKLDYPVRVYAYKCHAGIGTHLDAPSHFVPGGWNVADIPVEHLLAPACVLDVSQEMHGDLLISPSHLERFEQVHGPIPEGAPFLAHTGWGQFWEHPEKYRNPDAQGKMHFPGFSKEAAAWLLERKIAGIGIDTLSPDGINCGFPVHELVLGAQKYILENVANLDKLPAMGSFAISLPSKVRSGTEAPVRLIALS